MTNRTSRLAPSPTGALHLGNARTFLINWALARQGGWNLVMRMEDLDGPRNQPGAVDQALDVLQWLGLEYDGNVLTQSDDFTPYRDAMHALADQNLIYRCTLTRREIEQAASAPHDAPAGKQDFGRELHVPAHLRPETPAAYAFTDEQTNYRLVVPDEVVEIVDGFAGRSVQRPFSDVGDFVVWTRRGSPAYQLAVVVDDARQGVTDVVRADDLLSSASRQELLYRMLDVQPPRWWHVPLVIGEDGRRLAKRHGDTKLTTYREAGVSPQRVIGLLAAWCGFDGPRREMSANDFLNGFALDRLSPEAITFTKEDDRWLYRR